MHIFITDSSIAAIATPIGIAGVGVIRVSGPDSLAILKSIFRSKAFSKSIKANYAYVGKIIDPLSDAEIDQCLALYFKAPHSFTGEDCIEIQCHSSPYLLKRILDLLLSQGAVLAQKGEFSKRALLNGKLDLTQAEALIDLIHAESAAQHQVSLNKVQGSLYKHIQTFRKEFMHLLEQIEGSIDFPEEVPEINRPDATQLLTGIHKTLQRILSLGDYGKLISGGIHCLCVGKPNAGKSSLFNALINEDRSIVTNIPGTTRDYISESIQYKGYLFHITDTAGLRESDNIIEYMGMKKIHALIEKSSLILFVIDQSQALSDDDLNVYQKIKDHKNIAIILMKSDLPTGLKKDDYTVFNPVFIAPCSIHDEQSIHNLKEQLYQHTISELSAEDLQYICNVRQLSCIRRLQNHVDQALDTLKQNIPDDLLSVDIRLCVEICSELSGDALTEEMLDGVFSRFCVGK